MSANPKRNVNVSTTQRLVECAVLIALGTILSFVRIIDLPYGGSVTIASMLPVMIIAYRHGIGYGLVSAAVYGGIQQLLGLKVLGWVSTWQSVLAVIFLDYIVAFAVIGFGGIFRRKLKGNQALELCLGALVVCILRYICHVVSGATVWAGLSIPTGGAIIYSLAYNATYMVPETIVMVTAAYFIGTSLDFRFSTPVRITRSEKNNIPVFKIVSAFLIAAVIVIDVALVFGKLQDAETGDWNIGGLADVNWIPVTIVSVVGLTAAVIFALI